MTRVAVVQLDPRLGEVEANLERVLDSIPRAEARLIVFPECTLTGYGFESTAAAVRVAETIPGPSTVRIAEACRRAEATVVIGMLERQQGRLFNAAAVVDGTGVVGRYHKMHIPFMGVDRFVTPGELGFPVFTLGFGRIGVVICYDLSFPEAARIAKLNGAQVLCVPTNWPEAAGVSCHHAPFARAQENHLNVITANRVGTEAGFTFLGNSRVVDYDGRELAHAARNDGLLTADLDLAGADRNRVVFVPGRYEVDRIAHRRPEFYGPIVAS